MAQWPRWDKEDKLYGAKAATSIHGQGLYAALRALYRWRRRPAQPAAAQLDNWHCKPKHLRVIYANNLTVKGRQHASTVMLHGDLYLLREQLR